ncbi:hypothetical protein C5167_015952 [Papaver somniferum]|nr:hypothetical protein C5167_015952 [Papaver somniferum]
MEAPSQSKLNIAGAHIHRFTFPDLGVYNSFNVLFLP